MKSFVTVVIALVLFVAASMFFGGHFDKARPHIASSAGGQANGSSGSSASSTQPRDVANDSAQASEPPSVTTADKIISTPEDATEAASSLVTKAVAKELNDVVPATAKALASEAMRVKEAPGKKTSGDKTTDTAVRNPTPDTLASTAAPSTAKASASETMRAKEAPGKKTSGDKTTDAAVRNPAQSTVASTAAPTTASKPLATSDVMSSLTTTEGGANPISGRVEVTSEAIATSNSQSGPKAADEAQAPLTVERSSSNHSIIRPGDQGQIKKNLTAQTENVLAAVVAEVRKNAQPKKPVVDTAQTIAGTSATNPEPSRESSTPTAVIESPESTRSSETTVTATNQTGRASPPTSQTTQSQAQENNQNQASSARTSVVETHNPTTTGSVEADLAEVAKPATLTGDIGSQPTTEHNNSSVDIASPDPANGRSTRTASDAVTTVVTAVTNAVTQAVSQGDPTIIDRAKAPEVASDVANQVASAVKQATSEDGATVTAESAERLAQAIAAEISEKVEIVVVEEQAKRFVGHITAQESNKLSVERADHFVTNGQVLSLLPDSSITLTSRKALLRELGIDSESPVTVVTEAEQIELISPEKLIAAVSGNLDTSVNVLVSDSIESKTVRDVLLTFKEQPTLPISLVKKVKHFEVTTPKELNARQDLLTSNPLKVIRERYQLESATIAELLKQHIDIDPDSIYYVRTVAPGDDQGIWGIVHDGLVNNFAKGMAIRRGESIDTYRVSIPREADEPEVDKSSSYLGRLLFSKAKESHVYNFRQNRMGQNPDRIFPGQEIVIVNFRAEELINIYKHFLREEG